MNLIIRAIIKIFKEIFEQDRLRREKERQHRDQVLQQWHARKQAAQPGGKPPGQPPPGARPPQAAGASQPKTQLIQQIEALFGEVRPAAQPPSPPPIPVQQTKPVQKVEPRRSSWQKSAAREKTKSVKPKPKTTGGFQLPGKTPLEQMIFAKVILDPCKALQDEVSPYGRWVKE